VLEEREREESAPKKSRRRLGPKHPSTVGDLGLAVLHIGRQLDGNMNQK